jgi:hypothetical protein
LRERIEWPADGICFDIRNKVFWWPEWGERPAADADAIAVASRYLERVPVLIPIFGHSYLPSTPAEVGNPVFSVHQADVIHRGADLAEYLHYAFRDQEEFDEDRYPTFSEVYRPIRFWSSMARENARQ